MTDRELLADLLDTSVMKARKHLKETGQIEHKDVIPLVLHDYNDRFDRIDARLDQQNDNLKECNKRLHEMTVNMNTRFDEVLTKKEFNSHMGRLDERFANLTETLKINIEGVRSTATDIKWILFFSAAVITIVFAVSKWVLVTQLNPIPKVESLDLKGKNYEQNHNLFFTIHNIFYIVFAWISPVLS